MCDITSIVILWAKDIQNFLQIVATHYAEISPIKTYQEFRTFVKKNFQTGDITRFKHIGLWRYAQMIKPNHMCNNFCPAVALFDKVGKKKRKPAKNSSNILWVKPQKIFVVLDDIGRARQNIVEMTISRSCDTLRNGCTTIARHLRDESAKNRKIDKKRKNSFFLNFLHVSNRTRVRNGV
jgi:hypothetical protein